MSLLSGIYLTSTTSGAIQYTVRDRQIDQGRMQDFLKEGGPTS